MGREGDQENVQGKGRSCSSQGIANKGEMLQVSIWNSEWSALIYCSIPNPAGLQEIPPALPPQQKDIALLRSSWTTPVGSSRKNFPCKTGFINKAQYTRHTNASIRISSSQHLEIIWLVSCFKLARSENNVIYSECISAASLGAAAAGIAGVPSLKSQSRALASPNSATGSSSPSKRDKPENPNCFWLLT